MSINKKKRLKIIDKINKSNLDESLNVSVDEIEEKSLIDPKTNKIKVPKDYKREFYKKDKDQLIHRIFMLQIENEILNRQVAKLQKKKEDQD